MHCCISGCMYFICGHFGGMYVFVMYCVSSLCIFVFFAYVFLVCMCCSSVLEPPITHVCHGWLSCFVVLVVMHDADNLVHLCNLFLLKGELLHNSCCISHRSPAVGCKQDCYFFKKARTLKKRRVLFKPCVFFIMMHMLMLVGYSGSFAVFVFAIGCCM